MGRRRPERNDAPDLLGQASAEVSASSSSLAGPDELHGPLRRYRRGAGPCATKGLRRCVCDAGAEAFLPMRLLSEKDCVVHVATIRGLEACARTLGAGAAVGIDVERSWYRSYSGRTTLLQLSTAADGGRVFLVDCLQLRSKEVSRCLRPVLQDEKIVKVFHAAGNDLKWLRQEFQIAVGPILDTQVLAQKLGFPQTALTEQWSLFGNVHATRELKRRLQRSDWTRRPLLPLQAMYAAADSYLLLPIAGGLLRLGEWLRLPDYALGWAPEPISAPPPQRLAAAGQAAPEGQGDGRVALAAWAPPRDLAARCEVAPGLQLWEELEQAARGAAALAESCDSPGDIHQGVGLRRAARQIAPRLATRLVEALGEWRRRRAEEADESPQYIVPDELLARAAAASSRSEAEAALRGCTAGNDDFVEVDAVAVGLDGDEEQCAREAHLDDEALAECLGLLDAARAGRPLPSELLAAGSGRALAGRMCSDAPGSAHAKWWLPCASEQAFKQELSRLPKEQQQRVLQEPLRKRARFLMFIRRVSAKRPVYENCRILAPDRRVLCTVDSRKLAWYVNRGLGSHVDGDATSIILNFEPRGRFGIPTSQLAQESQDDGEKDRTELRQREHFYTTFKRNLCVVCGTEDNLARFNVVPSCYRSHLPASHQPSSHDVLLLCVPCHQRATYEHGTEVRNVLAARVGLSREVDAAAASRGDPRCPARTAALGLIKGGDCVPEDRVAVVYGRIEATWGADAGGPPEPGVEEEEFAIFANRISSETPHLHAALLKCSGLALRVLWRAASWAPARVKRSEKKAGAWDTQVVHLWEGAVGDLGELLRECRVQFLSAMQPRHMPEHWDVNHRVAPRGLPDLV